MQICLKQVDRSVAGYGGASVCLEQYQGLPGSVRELVDAAGFSVFIRTLLPTRMDRKLVRALVERWWDTTNSFHFQFGEMTITPLDFAATTGLRVGGDPIPFDSGLYLDRVAVRHFLGREAGDEAVVRCDHLPVIWDHEPATPAEAAQMARAYLLFLFGTVLFPNRQYTVHLGWLPALADLRTADRLDWGGSALGTLYCFLGSMVRGVGTTLGGYWRILEVCNNFNFCF